MKDAPSAGRQAAVRCREIGDSDIDAIADLLTEGCGKSRSRKFWVDAMARLAAHPTPPGFPRYGYMLDSGGEPVGTIFLISTAMQHHGGASAVRCNGSSVYVKPGFRSYGALLIARALRHKDAMYLNVTPAPHTLPLLEAQGYTRYCKGRVLAVPALGKACPGARVEAVAQDLRPSDGLSPFEARLLREHAAYGCLSVTCATADGRWPFVFTVRRKYGVIPLAFLVYCRALDNFVRFSRPLGRYLLRRGIVLAVVDANAPIQGLVGRYSDGNPKYAKGPGEPRLGDLAYTELAMLAL